MQTRATVHLYLVERFEVGDRASTLLFRGQGEDDGQDDTVGELEARRFVLLDAQRQPDSLPWLEYSLRRAV